MKIQDLKENRIAIIETITNELNASMVPHVMGEMVKMLGFNDIRSTNAVDYVKEVIYLCDIKVPAGINTLWGVGCKYSTQSEYQRSCMGAKYN